MLIVMKQNPKSPTSNGFWNYHSQHTQCTQCTLHTITMQNLNDHTLRHQGERKSFEHKLQEMK
jgi:hypothetical protein